MARMFSFLKGEPSDKDDALMDEGKAAVQAASSDLKTGGEKSGADNEPYWTVEQFLNHTPIAVALLNREGVITRSNPAFKHMMHVTHASKRSLMDFIAPDDHEAIRVEVSKTLEGKGTEVEVRPLDICLSGHAEGRNAMIYFSSVPDQEQVTAYLIETTEQKKLELRFTHSQKMQAVGQLAGGVAHDFNNLLTAMIGFCDLLLMRHPAGDPSFADLMQIKQNANRAANLVRQLLAFSRRQTLQPKLLDITDVIAELSNLIRRLIGEKIELEVRHGRDLWMARVDQGQLEQVIINLAVNARDAMPEGGMLSLITRNETVDGPLGEGYFTPGQDEDLPPGDYVVIELTDTGTGIPPAILDKIFEPFFSTKAIGSGTGLGLATVYGIIRQTGGHVFLRTEEGKGTSFYLYLKRAAEAEQRESEAQQKEKSADLTGQETILLVEDEAPVRIFAARALGNKGYRVMEADCAEAALALLEGGEAIDLIISDVIMPGMNGPAMVQEIRKTKPDIPVVFISGYAEDAFMEEGAPPENFHFLPKPFTLKQLAVKVKDVMQEERE